MTDIRKKQDNRNAKTKKLQMNKETLRDLSAAPGKGKQVKGGRKAEMSAGCGALTADC